jgi:predicted alpha/beta-fold hydrolase
MLSFKPSWWLNNAHLQTLYPSLFRKIPDLQLRRERLILPDGDFIDLDYCGEDKKQPLIILLHGLTGSAQSGYIKGLQHVLLKQNIRSVALNFRGCSGESNHSSRCYHSGETEDLDFVYRILRQREPNTDLAAVGFSLGGNMLLKWLGERHSEIDLFAAVAVSVPLMLSECATKLDSGFSKFYRANLLRELKKYIHQKKQHLEKLGNQLELEKLNKLGDLSDVHSFWEYDERVVAKLYGFQNAHDYYQRSSSRQFLKSIITPTLIIQALDDPFMTSKVLPHSNELSPNVHLEITKGGGHVGFVMGKNPFRPVYWLERRILAFLIQHTHQDKKF